MSRHLIPCVSFVSVIAFTFACGTKKNASKPESSNSSATTSPNSGNLRKFSLIGSGSAGTTLTSNLANPATQKSKIYKVAVSTKTDCSSPLVVLDNTTGGATPTYVDMLQNPVLGTGKIPDGTYPCLMMEMTDLVKFTPASTDASNVCIAGTEYTLEVCQPMAMGSTTFTPGGNLIDGTAFTCKQGEDRVAVYFSTASTSDGGASSCSDPTACNPFVPPTGGKVTNGITLGAALVVSGDVTMTYVVDASGTVGPQPHGPNQSMICEMQPPKSKFVNGKAKCANLYGGALQCPLTLSGTVSTFSEGTAGLLDDRDGLPARGMDQSDLAGTPYNRPSGITTDGSNLYFVENFTYVVRKLDTMGKSSIIAGTAGTAGRQDGTGTAASFGQIIGITSDGSNLYVTDSATNNIRQIAITTGKVTTLAGVTPDNSNAPQGGVGHVVDGTGGAARFYTPTGITNDGKYVYVTDSANDAIRKVEIATGTVTTLAGRTVTENPSQAIVDGSSSVARFNNPNGIVAVTGNLYVADTNFCAIRKVDSTGNVSTIGGSVIDPGTLRGTVNCGWQDNANGSAAQFSYPRNITSDGTSLYIVDSNNQRIRKMSLQSPYAVTTVAGSGTAGLNGGIGVKAQFNFANGGGITTDGTALYVSDYANFVIRKIL